MEQPRRFRIAERDGITTIEWRLLERHHLVAPLFLAIFGGMWWYWYWGMTASGPTPGTICFLTIAAALPLLTLHLTLAKFLNRARLVVDADTITLRQGPIPWPGNGRWPRASLQGFTCAQITFRMVTSFAVDALFSDRPDQRIAVELREDEARWLATTLDRRFAHR